MMTFTLESSSVGECARPAVVDGYVLQGGWLIFFRMFLSKLKHIVLEEWAWEISSLIIVFTIGY
jgi:hypothetical protein